MRNYTKGISNSRRTILIVDDDDCVKVSFQTLLELEGYVVQVAKSSTEAIAWLEKGGSPDLIITDYLMRDGNGDELVAYAQGKELPVVVLSGLMEEAKEALKRRGIRDSEVLILSKPVDDLGIFTAWIKRQLDPHAEGHFEIAS